MVELFLFMFSVKNRQGWSKNDVTHILIFLPASLNPVFLLLSSQNTLTLPQGRDVINGRQNNILRR